MRRALAIAAALAITAVAPRASAYRPFDGTDADTATLGELELELGPLGYLRASHDSAIVFANTILNLGFAPRWELVVEGVGLYGLDTPPPPRFVNGGVFLKHVVLEGSLQGKRGASLAIEFGALLPTWTEPVLSDGGIYLAMILSYAWPDLAVHFNAALARSPDGNPDAFTTIIVEGHPSWRVRPVSEVLLERHGDATLPSVLVGCIWRVNDRLSLDAASRLAWSSGAPVFEARAGLTWTITVFHPRP
jgi:hypothetical protein